MGKQLTHLTETQCLYNTKIKYYKDDYIKLTTFNRKIFNPDKVEKEKQSFRSFYKQNEDNESRTDSIKRAKEKIFDIAYSNDFDYFITLTLDKDLISRTDKKDILKKLNVFLSNAVQRKKLKYVIIPEYHKDNESIHFHGLIKADFKYEESLHKTKRGQTLYNIPEWKYGFTTAIKLDNNVDNISKYITKYITKNTDKIFGKFYLSGGQINRTVKTDYANVEFSEIKKPPITVIDKYLYVKYSTY